MSVPKDDPLGLAHAMARRNALVDRKAFQKNGGGALYRTFEAAWSVRAQALAAGDPKADADAIVTQALKAAWPKGREEPWHYVCDRCDDTGYVQHACPGDATCGRTTPHGDHTYVQPCWCAKGRALTKKPKPSTEDELASVGKTKKPRHPSRMFR